MKIVNQLQLLYEARRYKNFWLALLGFVVALLLPWALLPDWESRLRITGMLLQLGGVCVVAWGLHEVRQQFGRPSLSEIASGYFKRFSSSNVEVRVVGMSASALAGAHVTAYGTVSLPATASLEERIAALEQGQKSVLSLAIDNRSRIEQETHERKSELNSERGERLGAYESIRKSLEDVAVGGLYLEWVGVIWLLVGIVFGTAPSEVVRLFR